MCKETEIICLSCSSTITVIDTCSLYNVKSADEHGISHRTCQQFKPNVEDAEYVQKTDKEFHMCEDRRAGSAFPFSFLGMRSEDKYKSEWEGWPGWGRGSDGWNRGEMMEKAKTLEARCF